MPELKAIFDKWGDRLVMGGKSYSVVCIILVLVAAVLRFYELPENSLRYDEARVANQSRGTLSEVISNTRYYNSSPILYPMILYVVQTVESSSLSVRIVSATTSVLTIAVLLFLFPRVGVSRSAAFLAALMAAFSSKAIEHAQDVKEYSIDAFVAALLIAGLLAYLRNAKKVLLCTSLFIAPLIQYGLVVFCFAILATIWSLSLFQNGFKGSSWVQACKKSMCPCAFFAVGSAITYAVTLRYQWRGEGWGSDGYLTRYYYRGEYRDVWSIFEFTGLRTWGLLNYHLTETIAILALVAVGISLYGRFRKSQIDPSLVLCFLALASAAGAAVLGAYPYGGIRQCIYLGPILFFIFGHALHRATDILFPRRLRLTCLTLVASIAMFGGIASIRADNPYREIEDVKGVLIALEEQAKGEDVIYVSAKGTPAFQFYLSHKPDNYYYRGCHYYDSAEKCVEDIVSLMNLEYSLYPSSRKRMYLSFIVYNKTETVLQMLKDRWSIDAKEVFQGEQVSLYLLPNFHRLADRAELGDPISESDNYEIYLKHNRLVYIKKTEKCGNGGDSDKRFFLHIHPVDERDIPKRNRQYGYDYISFDPDRHRYFSPICHHFEIANQCVVECPLPEYDIDYIRTGQSTSAGVTWETKCFVKANKYKSAYRSISASEPGIRSHFDIYVNGDTLSYVKEPCAVGDTEARFFFDLIPADEKDFSDYHEQHGYDSGTFQFDEKGMRFDEKCIARVALPEYDIDYIRTGQYDSTGVRWETKFPIWANKYKAVYRSVAAGEPVIRSHFDVYLDGDTLSYVKEPCAVGDTEARFFFDLIPADEKDSQDHHEQHGYDSGTFQFGEKGVRFDEKCIARVALPEYDIDYIRTGQDTNTGRVWENTFSVKTAEYKSTYRSIAAGEPVIRSHFDVYLNGNTLFYVKEPCAAGDTEARFFLDLIPADEKDSLDYHEQHSYDSGIFQFWEKGVRFDEKCIARVVLPEYDLDYIRTGQDTNTGRVWENTFSIKTAKYKSAYRSIAAGEPVIRSHFDVYLDGNTLSYVKEPCTAGDAEARFFLAIYPLDTHDLPDHRKQPGYDIGIFQFWEKGMRFDEKCIARVTLPEYDIKFIKSVRWAQDGSAYPEVIYDFDLSDLYDLVAASNEPIIRSVFDVYLRNNTLMYLKEPCKPDDTDPGFYVHLFPVDEDDLPANRKQHFFDNHDFSFNYRGKHFGERCLATLPLPDYEIDRIRTGQWIIGESRNLWREVYSIE